MKFYVLYFLPDNKSVYIYSIKVYRIPDCTQFMEILFFPTSFSNKVQYPSVHNKNFHRALFPVVWNSFLSCAAEGEMIMYLVCLGRQRLLSTGPGREGLFWNF